MVDFRNAVGLLLPIPFESVAIEDDVIGSVIVRTSILKRLPALHLLEFVTRRLKPLMTADQILHSELDVEVDLDDSWEAE